jgi:hypothetical protein
MKAIYLLLLLCLPMTLGAQTPNLKVDASKLNLNTAPTAVLLDKDTYQLVSTHQALKVNQAAKLIFTVIPKTEHKINLEFPHRISIPGNADLDTGAEKYSGIIKDKHLQYEVQITPKKAGEFSLDANVNFSICNDKACYMNREKVTIQLKVQ